MENSPLITDEKFLRSAYTFLKKIGQGSQGSVYTAQKDDKVYAIKKIRRNSDNRKMEGAILVELSILKMIDHENIVK